MKKILNFFRTLSFLTSLLFLINAPYANEVKEGTAITIHVALSMNLPEETIKSLALEAKAFPARCVFRGIPLTHKEIGILQSRGHFGETKAIQEENRAIVRQGFKRLNDLAQNGFVFEIDPVFFREKNITAVPTIVFNDSKESVSLSGFTSIREALYYAITHINTKEAPEFFRKLKKLERESL